jgi:hypothetical protein
MKQQRTVAIFALASLLLLIDLPSAKAEAWRLPTDVKVGEELVGAEESYVPTRSIRQVVFDVKSSGDFQGRVCNMEYDSGDCDLNDASNNFRGDSILGVCETATEVNCVESFGLSTNKGEIVQGTYLRSVATPEYAPISSKGLPAFKSTPLFSVAGFAHLGGTTTYAPIVSTNFKWNRTTKRFYASSFQASVFPYTERSSSMFYAPRHENLDVNGRKTILYAGSGENCVWLEAGKCGTPQDFPEDVKVQLTIRLSSEIAGWFRGRLTAPNIVVTPFDSANNRIVIAGEPATVARFGAIATKENTTPEEQRIIGGTGGNPSSAIFAWLEMFRDVAKDRAIGVSRVWNVSTIDGISTNACLNDKNRLLGIVTTNATVYDGRVPDFVDGELSYKVAGMHYLPDGKTLASGTYDMVMRSDTARCLYGFSQAPIKASISVLSNEGSAQVATTSSGERDGWLYLSAKNFNFSTPTIKVKLSQEVPTAPSAQPSEVAKSIASVEKKGSGNIVCLKGSKSLTLKSKKSKCPKGYRKA